MIVNPAQGADRGNDGAVPVGDKTRLDQINPDACQFARQEMHVRVAGAAAQDFIADDQDGSGGIGHGASVKVSLCYRARDTTRKAPAAARHWPTADFVTIYPA